MYLINRLSGSHNLTLVFPTFAPKISKGTNYIQMTIQSYPISMRYANKIHDFHAWGVAALI